MQHRLQNCWLRIRYSRRWDLWLWTALKHLHAGCAIPCFWVSGLPSAPCQKSMHKNISVTQIRITCLWTSSWWQWRARVFNSIEIQLRVGKITFWASSGTVMWGTCWSIRGQTPRSDSSTYKCNLSILSSGKIVEIIFIKNCKEYPLLGMFYFLTSFEALLW